LQALSECLHAEQTALRNIAKAGGQDTHLPFKARHCDGGMENDDVSLFPVEEEDFTNPQPDEDPNGWQTLP